jgi:hypothetical protein
MPEEQVVERARHDKEEGKSPSTQAGEFVREEMHHIREGMHGVQSPQQAIAIGLSKARRAGVKLPPPKRGKVSSQTRAQAARDSRKGRRSKTHKPSPARSRAISKALKRKGRSAAPRGSLSWASQSAAFRQTSRSHKSEALTCQTKCPKTQHPRPSSQPLRSLL